MARPGLSIVGEEDVAALDEDFELATPLDDALPPPRRSYMRGARLLLGTAMAGSRMAAAIESEAMSVVAQRMIDGCWQNLLARNAAMASES